VFRVICELCTWFCAFIILHGFVLSSSLMVLFQVQPAMKDREPLQDELLVLLESPPYWVLLVG
jgi:hypothetical protein